MARGRDILGAVAACSMAFCTPAFAAGIQALGVRGAGPVLSGSRVVWSQGSSVLAAPIAGGAPSRLFSLPGVSALSASGDSLAVVAGDALFVDGRRLTPSLGSPPFSPIVPAVAATDVGVAALEDSRLYLHDARGRRLVPLPPGADPAHVAVGGRFGVAPVPEGALVVFDLESGSEQRQISLGSFNPVNVEGLALSPTGDVALTVPAGDGDDVLLWAPAGSSRVRVLARGRTFGIVAAADGRVAYVRGTALGGSSVVVVDGSGRVVSRGPVVGEVRTLSFDGAAVGFSTGSCLVVETGSNRALPAGPCSRTVILSDREGGQRVRVACLNAPGASCRVRVRSRGGRVRVARVARGRVRVLRDAVSVHV